MLGRGHSGAPSPAGRVVPTLGSRHACLTAQPFLARHTPPVFHVLHITGRTTRPCQPSGVSLEQQRRQVSVLVSGRPAGT